MKRDVLQVVKKRLLCVCAAAGLLFPCVVMNGCMTRSSGHRADECRFPTVNSNHVNMLRLLGNAMAYVRPENGLVDPSSGYPCEGWNDEAEGGLRLRGFTQLTAIGSWMEMLAHVAAGYADSPYLGREEALRQLEQVVDSLVADQQNPRLSDRGLLCNFMGFEDGQRVPPLASVARKQRFCEVFGQEEGGRIWQALQQKGWVKGWRGEAEGEIQRGPGYGVNCFTGVLAPYRLPATARRILGVLDQRVVQVVFGDNANLASSAAKTQGALLDRTLAGNIRANRIRHQLECFLAAQQPGYAHLYDAQRGLFRFGWNATEGQFLGWADKQGEWHPGYSDYLVNEFRAPTQFVLMRHGMPSDALRNLGFRMKSMQGGRGKTYFTLAPWEGSAFQALGLSLFMDELNQPGWRALLENAVRVNIDYARTHGLPGFLSESYTGNGVEYSGHVGLPGLAVTTEPRITNAPSIYTLGVAYAILPDEVESLVAACSNQVEAMLTSHGPWEGYLTPTGLPIKRQTTGHVMSLLLGGLNCGTEFMRRYCAGQKWFDRWGLIYPRGGMFDVLGRDTQMATWSPRGGAVHGERVGATCKLRGEGRHGAALTWTFVDSPQGVSFAGGVLRLVYRNGGDAFDATLVFEDRETGSKSVANIVEVVFAATGTADGELRIPLPSTPGMTGIRKVSLIAGPGDCRAITLDLLQFQFIGAPADDDVAWKTTLASRFNLRGGLHWANKQMHGRWLDER